MSGVIDVAEDDRHEHRHDVAGQREVPRLGEHGVDVLGHHSADRHEGQHKAQHLHEAGRIDRIGAAFAHDLGSALLIDSFIAGGDVNVVLLDQHAADRTAEQAAHDQAERGGSDGDGLRTDDAERFGGAAECRGRAVTAFKRNGSGHDAEHGVNAEHLGQTGADAVLDHSEQPAEDQVNDQCLAALGDKRKAAADTDRGEEGQHHRRLKRGGELDRRAAVVVQDQGHDGHDQTADDRRRDAERLKEAQLAAQTVAKDQQQQRDSGGPQRVELEMQHVFSKTP